MGYLIRNIFMEKVCKKPAAKTSSTRLFNLGNSPKQPMHWWDFWKKIIFKGDHEKGNLIFYFAPSDFLWRKFWKAKMPETSYQSLELQGMLRKNGNFEKRFSKFLKCFFWGKIWKIEDTSFVFEYPDSY